MSTPVDVVVAVHTPTRPIAGAVRSVLDDNGQDTRLTVVCHDVDIADIAAVLDPGHADRVSWMEHRDGVPSASGPFNAGMRAAGGEFVSIMGSDDILRPGAVGAWLRLARATRAETVVTRLALGTPGNRVPTPPTRPRRRSRADVVSDRLSYRSAPLGLVSTEARRRLGAELVEGMPVGGDVAYVTRLWCETRVVVEQRGPGYVIGEDATDRVTYDPRPIDVELAFLRHLIDQPWFTAYPEAVRTAVATKLLRIHVFGAVTNRPLPTWWTTKERRSLAEVTRHLWAVAPALADPLSRADHALVAAIKDPALDAAALVARARARRRHGTPATVIPAQPRMLLHREAPPRFMAASWWATR